MLKKIPKTLLLKHLKPQVSNLVWQIGYIFLVSSQNVQKNSIVSLRKNMKTLKNLKTLNIELITSDIFNRIFHPILII